MKVKNLLKALVRDLFYSFYKWRGINVILVISTGRTGTEFVARLLKNIYSEKVLSLHEPKPDLLDISVRSRAEAWTESRIVKNIIMARTRYCILCKHQAIKHYVESNNNLSFLLPYLKHVFPKLKIIYFTRSPETFLLSELNKKHGKEKFLLFGNDDQRERITPFLLNAYEHDWNNWSRAQRITWYWVACNNFIVSNIKGHDHLIVKYEDFFDIRRSQEKLNEIIRFAGLPEYPLTEDSIGIFFNQKINASKVKTFDDLDGLSKEELDFFYTRTAMVAKSLAY